MKFIKVLAIIALVLCGLFLIGNLSIAFGVTLLIVASNLEIK